MTQIYLKQYTYTVPVILMSADKRFQTDDPWRLTAGPPDVSTAKIAPAKLTVQRIDGITPLDAQMGVVAKKTAPDLLNAMLFEPQPPTAAEIELYGNIETMPPLRTYAVLNAAKMPYVLTGLLEKSGQPYQSLFQGRTADELREHAPYLVELDSRNDLTRRLFTGTGGTRGLWHDDLGIFIRSRAGFAEMRRHLRKFTRIRRQDGQWYYFAFCDPGSLGWLALNGPWDFPDRLARPGLIREIFAFSDDLHVRIAPPDRAAAPAAPQSAFALDDATWASLGVFVETRFFRRLRAECLRIAKGAEARVDAALTLLAAEMFRSRPVLSDLAHWWSAADGAAVMDQPWARSELIASRDLPDDIRRDRLRNLSEEQAFLRSQMEKGTSYGK